MEDEENYIVPFEIETYKGKYMKIKRNDFKIILDPNKYDINS